MHHIRQSHKPNPKIPSMVPGGDAYMVPNNQIDLLKQVGGQKVYSGVIVSAAEDVTFVENEIARQKITVTPREFSAEETLEIDSGGSKTTWRRVKHEDLADVLPLMAEPISDPNTRMTTVYVYLSGDDIQAYDNALDSLGVHHTVMSDKAPVVRSQIAAYPPFSVDDLLVSYYEGLNVWHRESGDPATINSIDRGNKNRTVSFTQTVNGTCYEGATTMKVFFERFSAIEPSVHDGKSVNGDLLRYYATGERKLMPLTSDVEYLDAARLYAKRLDGQADKQKGNDQSKDSDNLGMNL